MRNSDVNVSHLGTISQSAFDRLNPADYPGAKVFVIGSGGTLTEYSSLGTAWKQVAPFTDAQVTATQSLVSGARILASGADVAGSRTVTGTTSEVSLALVTVPANALGTNGAIRISGWCSHTNGASVKTLRVKFGAMVLTHAPTINVSEQWTLWIRNVATNAQRAHASVASSQGATGSAVVTGSVDTTTEVQVVITGQLAVGTDFLTLEGFCVELLP